MKINTKKILAGLFVAGALTLSVPALAEDVQPNAVQKPSVSVPVRKPTSKKQLAMKFAMAMMGVAASSVIIYVMLTVYNRFIYGTPKAPQPKSQDEEFKTPTNMKDALEIFLKKTK
ncbi:MAG: hypothetical protein K6E29_08880 [Cyanobacteria bacterium RUI128]|nr:hypothetical protein [Cyanobacteria bacterium RUI128]